MNYANLQIMGTTKQSEDMAVDRLKKEPNDKMCIRELQGALATVVYN